MHQGVLCNTKSPCRRGQDTRCNQLLALEADEEECEHRLARFAKVVQHTSHPYCSKVQAIQASLTVYYNQRDVLVILASLRAQAIRAPLTVAVLGGYRAVCGEAWRGELRAVFPHLARLICSGQPSVRAALAGLLQAQLPPLIAEL